MVELNASSSFLFAQAIETGCIRADGHEPERQCPSFPFLWSLTRAANSLSGSTSGSDRLAPRQVRAKNAFACDWRNVRRLERRKTG